MRIRIPRLNFRPHIPSRSGTSATSIVTWTSPVSGTWETGSNWSDLSTPAAPQYVNIAQPVKVTVEGSESADGLRIGAGAILNLASGATLEVSQGIADFGTLQINSSGSDPTLAINGTVYLLNSGTLALVGPTDENLIIGVAGTDAKLVNVNNTITGSGTIGQGDGALTLVNGKNGTIEATPLLASDSGLLIIDTGNRDSNSGTLTAAAAWDAADRRCRHQSGSHSSPGRQHGPDRQPHPQQGGHHQRRRRRRKGRPGKGGHRPRHGGIERRRGHCDNAGSKHFCGCRHCQ